MPRRIRTASPALPVPVDAGEIPMGLEEFTATHSPIRERPLMAGFAWWAKQNGWTKATRDEWLQRYEAFRVMEV